MTVTDRQPPRMDTIAARLGRWGKYAASPIALAAALTAVLCGVRSIELTHSFEPWVGGLPLGCAMFTKDAFAFFVVLPVVLAVVWVVRQPLGRGYTQALPVSLAGRRELPSDRGKALGAHVDGTDERDGSLGTGTYYPDQVQRIAQVLVWAKRPGRGHGLRRPHQRGRLHGHSARQLDPAQDSWRPDDPFSDPDVANWSSFRWTFATVRAVGLGAVGEIPGPARAPGAGAKDQTDPSGQQMNDAPRYAQECGMALLKWPFDDDLFGDDRAGVHAERLWPLANGLRLPSRSRAAAETAND